MLAWILVGLLTTIIIALIVYNGYLILTNKSKARGQFALHTRMSGVTLRRCGANKDEECILIKRNLDDAVTECELMGEECNTFTYSYEQQEMRILDPNFELEEGGEDVYIRQST